MGDELKRNFLGFMLLIAGVGLVLLSARIGLNRLSDAGFSFIGMAGLALQVTPQAKKNVATPPEHAE